MCVSSEILNRCQSRLKHQPAVRTNSSTATTRVIKISITDQCARGAVTKTPQSGSRPIKNPEDQRWRAFSRGGAIRTTEATMASGYANSTRPSESKTHDAIIPTQLEIAANSFIASSGLTTRIRDPAPKDVNCQPKRHRRVLCILWLGPFISILRCYALEHCNRATHSLYQSYKHHLLGKSDIDLQAYDSYR